MKPGDLVQVTLRRRGVLGPLPVGILVDIRRREYPLEGERELDYVVLVGVDAEAFPAKSPARHLLHVGATRGAHQLWIISTGTPSPLIPPGLAGLDGLGTE